MIYNSRLNFVIVLAVSQFTFMSTIIPISIITLAASVVLVSARVTCLQHVCWWLQLLRLVCTYVICDLLNATKHLCFKQHQEVVWVLHTYYWWQHSCYQSRLVGFITWLVPTDKLCLNFNLDSDLCSMDLVWEIDFVFSFNVDFTI